MHSTLHLFRDLRHLLPGLPLPGPILLAATLLGTTLLGTGCGEATRDATPGVLVVAQETQAMWVRNFNPFLPAGAARWPSRGGIYEPLAIYNRVAGEWVPWLAERWSWEDDGRTLRFSLRPGVSWSDGASFGAADVVATYALMREHAALDLLGVWGWLAEVTANVTPEREEVIFRFARPFAPGFDDLAETPIVPAHVWSALPDPFAFANPDPVATGPFTEVLRFEDGVYELGRNPNYWMPGRPAVEALRMPAFAGNDSANLALIDGELDWAGNYVPSVDRTFVARDPAHHLAWSPPVESTVFLYANTALPAFADARVRQALSRAIDRDQLVAIAMDGTTHPSDGTGLSDALAPFRDPQVAANDWVQFDPAESRRLLDEAGLTVGSDGVRVGPDGPIRVELLVVAGWSDWIRAAQILSRDLTAVGLDVRVRTVDFAGWLDRLQHGDFALSLGWSAQGPTPYATYRQLMSTASVRPVGELSANWQRYASPAADALLAAVEATPDPSAQAPLFRALEAVFAAEAPAIPLFPGPSWGVASTVRFEGFPTADNPWAGLSPNHPPETLLVLTALVPR